MQKYINLMEKDTLMPSHRSLQGFVSSKGIAAVTAFQKALYIWDATRENLSSGFLTKWDSNQPAQLQILARKLKFRL